MANMIISKAMAKKGFNEETLAKKVGVKRAKVVDWINDYEIPSANE